MGLVTAVRLATKADVPELAALYCQEVHRQQRLDPVIQTLPGADWAAYVAARLRRRNAAIFVAEDEGRLVGYVDVRIAHQGAAGRRGLLAAARRLIGRWRGEAPAILAPRRYGFIEDLYVHPGLRGRAVWVGMRLLNAGIHWCRQHQLSHVEGAIAMSNESARALADRLGFVAAWVLVRREL